MYKYAQLDKTNVCIGEATSSNIINQSDMIPCENVSVGMQWINEAWVDGPELKPDSTEYEKIMKKLNQLEDMNLYLIVN